MSSLACLIGLTGLTLATMTSSARACSPLHRCLTLGSVHPDNGDQGVLRNVELRLNYDAYFELEKLDTLPTVLDAQGQAVEVEWTRSLAMLRGRLRAPLAAQSAYTIRHAFAPCTGQCGDDSLCPSDVGAVIATFTTSDMIDDTIPSAVLFEEPRVTPTLRATQPSECGPYDRCIYVRKFAPLEPGQILRLMQGDKTIVEQDSRRDLSINVYEEGSRYSPISGASQQLGAATYSAYVVDEAGNRSEPVELAVPRCALYAGGPSDAGSPAAGDSGARAVPDAAARDASDAASANDESELDTRSGDGCGVTSAPSDKTGSWGWLLTLALCLRSRVRARRSEAASLLTVSRPG